MKYLFLWIGLVILTGCKINQFIPDRSRAFNINGKWVSITPELQKDLRSHWSKYPDPIMIKTGIPTKEDTLYILDSIAIQEVLTDGNKCKSYEVIDIAKTNLNQLSEKDKKYHVGRLDEIWTVSTCGNISKYRVLEIADGRGLSLYKLTP